MKILKFITTLVLTIIIFTFSCLVYAFNIEPYRIKVTEHHLNEKIENTEPIKIIQFSDVHIKEDFTYENLNKVVKSINYQNPDIVLFTGDLYDNFASYRDNENIINQLQNINAKYAKIAIWGNRDYGGGAVRQYENIMNESGFTLLKNQNHYVTLQNNKKIMFTGLDDSSLGNPYMPDSTKIYDADYDILLTHEPDDVNNYLDYDYDITLSGHSHGGQINIPFFENTIKEILATTSLSTQYIGGMYDLSPSNNEKMYVNTGIGTTHISARFGVVSEISVFYLYL